MANINLALVDTCDILRYGDQPQGYGQKRVPQPHLSDVPCRKVAKEQRALSSVTGHFIEDTDDKFFFECTVDVMAGDRITNLRRDDGTLVQEDYEVGGVFLRRGHMARHLMATVRKIV